MRFSDVRRIALTSCAIVVVITSTIAYTFSGKNGTLVRNSLVAGALPEAAFSWSPEERPADYLQESMPAPDFISAVTDHPRFDRTQDNVAKAETIVEQLHTRAFRGRSIRGDLRETYSLIVNEGRGYCADYSKLFNAFAHSLNIPVREWAFGRDGFGSGHTFNEIYSYAHDKWVFIDAYHAMTAEDERTGELMSVLEFRRALSQPGARDIKVNYLVERAHRPRATEQDGLDFYAKSAMYFYLLWGNNVFQYDADSRIQLFAGRSRALERLAAIVTGVYPHVRMLEAPGNGDAIQRILTVRFVLMGSLLLLMLLGAYLMYLLLRVRVTTL